MTFPNFAIVNQMSKNMASGAYPNVLNTDIYGSYNSPVSGSDQTTRFNNIANGIIAEQKQNNFPNVDVLTNGFEQRQLNQPTLMAMSPNPYSQQYQQFLNTTAPQTILVPVAAQNANSSTVPNVVPVIPDAVSPNKEQFTLRIGSAKPIIQTENPIILILVIAAVVFILYQIWSSQKKIEFMLNGGNRYPMQNSNIRRPVSDY